MLFLYLGLFLVAFGVICFGWYLGSKKSNDCHLGGTVFLVFAIIAGLIGFLVTGIKYVSQVDDFENIKKFQKVEKIYQAKATALTSEFAKYLAQTYPEHERDIYDKISPEKVDLYFVKYPELRASETMVTLVAQINKLQSDVYNQQIAVEQAKKDIRSRLRNPWLFTSMLPTE